MPETSDQSLPLLPGWISKQIEKYISKKNQADNYYTTSRRNIYILPSKAGLFYTLVLLIILIGAINYNNSLAYLLCFFLASLGFVDMLQTHQNLKNIRINHLKTSPSFCGETVHYQLTAINTDNKPHIAIQLHSSHNQSVFYLDDKHNTQQFEILQPASIRGKLLIKPFKLFTEYPLGLFHAWSQINLNTQAIIYPKPVKTTLYLSNPDHEDETSESRRVTSGDEFAGIREHRTTDSPKIMAWKKIAQTGDLYSKSFESEAGSSLVFRLSDITQTHNLEEKLSILCQLILDADRNNQSYGLELGDHHISINSGTLHKHNCLTALALY